MLAPRHPHPPGAPQGPPPGAHQGPPPGAHQGPPPGVPQQFAPPAGGAANLPSLTEKDQELLRQLLDNNEQAQALWGMLQSSPPEIAALGYLILRTFESSQSN